jgi:ferrochelatase
MNMTASSPRWGLLLVNLGTPDSPGTRDVRRYLREFLSDPRVLDIAPALRAFLLNVVILPTRPARSGRAYRKIWTERGSPLLFHTEDLRAKVSRRLGPEVKVEIAMRYQNPSIGAALDRMRAAAVDRIVVLPLFPQYSSAAFGSAVEKVWEEASRRWNTPAIHIIDAFYEHPAFIEAFRAVARPHLDDLQPDRVLFSFHGVPERHVIKSDESEGRTCLKSGSCCDQITPANRFCYRAQCFATARALARALHLEPGTWEISFQSRLGRDPWIRPYTDERIEAMAKEGVKRLAVLCPAFVADCLETIEEIGMEGAKEFREHGGDVLRLIPSLNSEEAWVDAVTTLALEHAPTAWRQGVGSAGVDTPEVPA